MTKHYWYYSNFYISHATARPCLEILGRKNSAKWRLRHIGLACGCKICGRINQFFGAAPLRHQRATSCGPRPSTRYLDDRIFTCSSRLAAAEQAAVGVDVCMRRMSKPSLQMKWKDELWEQSHRAPHLSLAFSLALTLFWQLFREESCMCGLSLIILSPHFVSFPLFSLPLFWPTKQTERQRNLQEEEVSEQQMLYFQIFHSIKNEKQQSNRALLQMEFHNAEEMS